MLLSNLTDSYQESNLFTMSERLRSEDKQLDSVLMINENLVRDLMKGFYDTAGNSLRLNHDLNQLSFDDRSILLHTAADNVTCLGGLFVLQHSQLIFDRILWTYLENLYGTLTMSYHRWSAKYSEPDVVVFKLILFLFAFSSNGRTLHSKYGYDQAIRKFLHLIRWLLSVTVFMSQAHCAQTHQNDIQSLIEQTEITLLLDDVDRVV